MLWLNNFLMPKQALYMPSYTYLIEGLSSQSTIRNKRIIEDIRFTTIKQSFQNLLSNMIETATLLLLSLEYLESTKNLLVTKACKSCLWSWKLLNAMNVVAKRVASSRRILAYPSLFLNQFNKETWLYTNIVILAHVILGVHSVLYNNSLVAHYHSYNLSFLSHLGDFS